MGDKIMSNKGNNLIKFPELDKSIKHQSMLAIAILAAGKGTRMKSSIPKVLQPLGGKTLLQRVLETCLILKPEKCFLIVGHESDKVMQSLPNKNDLLSFVIQKPQNGTGHAVQQLIPYLADFKGDLLVLNGDVPLLKSETIKKLIKKHKDSNCDVTFLTSLLTNPKGYGRVFSESNGKVNEIIEDKDCNETQLKNKLTNAGIYCFKWNKLVKVLKKLSSNNKQNEIYLTDSISQLESACHLEAEQEEVMGINDKIQLAQCEKALQARICNYWMSEGVTITNPESCSISEDANFGQDVIIEPQTHIRGKCDIGNGCVLGPGSLIKDSIIGKNSSVTLSVLNNCEIKDFVSIGPFANIRPHSKIFENCRIGNFVEVKQSTINKNTKINHLSYIGDSSLGENVNIGAGTITANFDGFNKHKTVIGDHTKTGANSVLVAPINIGSKVTIAGGSTITKDVPSGSLALERSKQHIKLGWANSKESK